MSEKEKWGLMADTGKDSVIFYDREAEWRCVFVKSSGKTARFHFFVALCPSEMYNNKPRQAEACFHGKTGRPPGGRAYAAEVLMLMTTALNSILGLYIILVLVLVVLVPKKNSAFGHARNRGAGNPGNTV